MRKLLTIIFLFISISANCLTRYWVGGGASTNWNATGNTNWSATSGGANNASVPGSGDDVIFDANSNGGASVISATITVLSFTIVSGYTQTITHNAALTVAGNVTFATGYTIAGTSALVISAASTITSGGKTWPNAVTFSNNNTKTLVGNWTISGSLTNTGTTVLNWTTNETLSAGGLSSSSGGISGTAGIILTGGTWSGGQAIQNNMSIAGNVTVSGGVAYNTGTLTYTSGTVTTTGSTLTVAAATTLNTNGISWNNVTFSTVNLTYTINSLLTVTGTLTISPSNGTYTIAGTAGFTAGTFSCAFTGATTVTLQNSITYTITTAFNCFSSRIGTIPVFASNDGTLKAILTLQQGATCNVLANFTRIDAGAGRSINTFNGTVTSCTNVNAFNDLKTVASTFVQ